MRVLIVAALVALACAADPTFSLRGSFDLADADKDGKIQSAEFDGLYNTFDDNNDGVINATEFATHYTKTGMSPEGSVYIFYRMDKSNNRELNKTEIDGTFNHFDANDDMEVTFEEYSAVMNVLLGELAQAKVTGARLDVMFDNADADDDKMLTIDEFKGLLQPADTNGDKQITVDEFKVYWMAQTGEPEDRTVAFFNMIDGNKNGIVGEEAEVKQHFDGFDYNKDGKVSESEFDYAMLWFFAQIMESQGATAMTLKIDYQKNFDMADTNNDDVLDLSEFEAIFNQADTDKSGDVNVTEYVIFFSRETLTANQALFTFFLTDSNDNKMIDDEEILASFNAFDHNKDGNVTFEEYKKEDMLLVEAIKVATKSGEKVRAMMQASDVNKDDILSGDEMWSIVSPADLDGNGISEMEFVAFWMPKTGYSKDLTIGTFKAFDGDKNGVFGGPGGDAEKDGVYKAFDYNKDGSVSFSEFQNAMIYIYAKAIISGSKSTMTKGFSIEESFKMADKDMDGYISKSEFVKDEMNITAFVTKLTKKGLTRGAALYIFFRGDTNEDNNLDKAEMEAGFDLKDADDDDKVSLAEYAAFFNKVFSDLKTAEQTGKRLDLMFAAADANNDTMLTKSETDSLFAGADTDKDNLLTLAEFKPFWMRQTMEPEARTDVLFGILDTDSDGSYGNDNERTATFDGFDYTDDNMVSKQEFDDAMLFLYAKVLRELKVIEDAKTVIGYFF